MTLEDLVRKLQGYLDKGRFDNEQSVREALVVPVLQALGWDTLDPDIVVREYGLGTRRVDYALTPGNGLPGAIIEVKAPGQLIHADRQLFEYSFHEGVPFAILTDGNEWHFFVPGEQGAYSDRRVYKLDLSEREPGHAANIFKRYLEYNRFKSGEALDDARRDYRDKARRKEADAALPKAWDEIVRNREELLLDLLAEKAESLAGVRPEAEQVEDFIASYLDTESVYSRRRSSGKTDKTAQSHETASDYKGRSTKNTAKNGSMDATSAASSAKRGSRQVQYEITGTRYTAPNAKQALLDILQELAKQDSQFFEKLAPRVRTKKRNHIARRKEDVYPERPDLADSATEIAPGWWVGLNIANREKRRILERACDVAGLRYGKDLKIELPNN